MIPRGRSGPWIVFFVVTALLPASDGLKLNASGQAPPAHPGPVSSDISAIEPTRVDLIREFLLDAKRGGCLVVAHRGHHADAPENSLSAIRDAIELGSHIVEIDVRVTSDGRYLLMHDATLDRTTNGKGSVDTQTWQAMQHLRLLHGLRPTSERIPTLEEAFRAAHGQIMLNIDLKAGDLRTVVGLAAAEGVLDHCVFKGELAAIAGNQIDWLRAQPGVVFMPIVQSMAEAEQAMSLGDWPALEVVIKDGTRGGFDAQAIKSFSERGVRIWINTLWNGRLFAWMGDEQAIAEPAEVYVALARDGVSLLQTDLPDLAISTLRRHGILVP